MVEPLSGHSAATRWLHRAAVVTALVTLPLLFLGAEVTTKQVGMVDPAWPTPPWALLESTAWERGIGFLIEHGHRLAGWTVGACVTFLLIAVWVWEPRRWVRWLALAAFVGVGVQGLLGGFRVRLNALFGSDLALIHGCFGQLVFSLIVSLALCTSRRWREDSALAAAENSSIVRRWSLIVTSLLVVQLVLGALVRHKGLLIGMRGHFLVAFAVAVAITWLAKTVWDGHGTLTWAVRILTILLAVQVMLGVEAWMVRFAATQVFEPGHWLFNRDLVRSAHVLVGALLLATSVAVTLEAYRRPRDCTPWASPMTRLEEAAA